MSLGEADTRAKLITPAILKCGWTEDNIRREETPGPVKKIDGRVQRERGRVDYVLRLPGCALPVAFIEAKKKDDTPGSGLEQVKGYRRLLNVPFVYSTNGQRFVEYDGLTSLTSNPNPMEAFPSPDELRRRYESGKGFTLDSEAARPLMTPYAKGESGRRYYQDAAIRTALEAMAQGRKRMLLSMATGTGKTRVAVDLMKRIADAKQLKRVLFVCDRTELRDQALGAFRNEFGSDAAEVKRTRDGGNAAKNARIHIATYQTLGVEGQEGEASFLFDNYSEDDFSHIIIDECHRSAWGKWRGFLERNPGAVHIGLTATPRQLKVSAKTTDVQEGVQNDERFLADNLGYFGEPVYEYSMQQAMDDGYLALCEIQAGRANLDITGVSVEAIMQRRPVDLASGRLLTEDEIKGKYDKGEFEKAIMLPDRVRAMCQDLFRYLEEDGGPEQKTVVFCAGDYHAQMVSDGMNNLYAEWCKENGKPTRDFYAFKCTAASDGNKKLGEFRSSRKRYFIATTVDLLTTGVDVPCLKNVVFFKYVRSPIDFHQMLGRGTRIDEKNKKLSFTVYDYTNATELLGEDFITEVKTPSEEDKEKGEKVGPPPVIEVEGFKVEIADKGRYVIGSVDGRTVRLTVEKYRERMTARLKEVAPTIDDLRERWIDRSRRAELNQFLRDGGYPPEPLRVASEMGGYDSWDVLGEAGYGLAPVTRHDRVDGFQEANRDWLEGMGKAGEVARALAGQFAEGGTPELENPRVFNTHAVQETGGIDALGENAARILHEIKERLFKS